MDEFKKYLQQHADELNQDEPSPGVWQHIQQHVPTPQKATMVTLVTRWAAAACVLALAGIGAWWLFQGSDDMVTIPATASETRPAVIPKQPMPQDALTEKSPENITAKAESSHNPVTKKIAGIKKQLRAPEENLAALYHIENSFIQVINLQRARVSTMPMLAEDPTYFNDFIIQMKQMEKDEKAIKSDIVKRGMTDELLDQLIHIYQQKLNVLKQLQTEMNKLNNRYKQNRGPVDTTRTYFLNI